MKDKSHNRAFVGTIFYACVKAPLTINITPEEWNTAFADDYKDTVTFEMAYIHN